MLASLAAVAALVIVVVLQSRASVVVPKRQAALLEGIERRSPARIRRLVAEGYTDRWEFTREDLVETMLDGGASFLTLVVTAEDNTLVFEEGRAVVTQRLTLGGNAAGPAGQEVMRLVNRLGEPFVFTWEKQSFLASSWRLVEVDNPDLPQELYGYEPGDLRRMMRGE